MNLTKRVIDSLKPTEKRVEYSDDSLKGFVLRVYPSGRKSFMIRYRIGRASKRYAIGDFGKWTLEQARKEAVELLRLASKGEDPAQTRRDDREVPTFGQFAERYLVHASGKISLKDDQNKLNLRLIPAWGNRPVNTITERDVRRMIASVKSDGRAIATCNRYLALIKTMFNFFIHEKIIDANPAERVKIEQENNQRTRWLDEDELGRLFQALEKTSPVSRAAIGLMLFTGARSGSVLSARWADIDMDRKQWRIPFTKGKKSSGQVIPLNDAAMEILESQEDVKIGMYVFPGQKPGAHLTTVKKPWATAIKNAGIEDMKIHDLRHTFASMVLNSGAELYHVQQLLGHKTGAMTQRYAHIKDEALRKASSGIAQVVSLDKARKQKKA
ncbi:MAG: tyrosine-type recombinase/integrase [Magnetococcales bacterium]|nr:tyrosine-type recombinase/integrase [Magnetococcales bacterium]